MFNAPLPKIRDTARLLYKGYVAQQYTKYSAFHIVSTLDSKTIDLYLAEVIALNKKYNLFYDTVDYDFSPSVMDKHIKNAALANYKSAISELTDELKKDKKISKAKPKAGSPKAKAKAKAPKVKAKAKAKVGSPKVKAKAKAKAKAGSPKVKAKAKAKVGSPKAKAKAKAKAKKGCADYSMADLRSMASTFRIAGASKMRKTELCSALGI